MILSSLPSLRTTTRLVVLDGPVHGRQFSLGRQLTTIGRSIGCHVTVEADAVAYDHARVVRTPDGWKIELIGGATDLTVNDDPVRDARTLQDGDIIKVGPARLRFESAGQAG
jgi:pSer/pThr/pTyr-binding forkhead associated (FHA) protein